MKKQNLLPPLNALRAFESAARLGSLTKAAQALGVTQAAVSQQIRTLEEHLGAELFHRQGRRITLTNTGQAYLPALTAAFDGLLSSTAELFTSNSQNLIRVKVANSFAQRWLIPRLPRFYRRYPAFRVQLQASTWPSRGELEGADLEIANGYGDWAGLEVEQLTREHWQVVASPGFLAQHPSLDDPEVFLELPRISILGYQENWQSWFREAGLHLNPLPAILETDTSNLAIEAACSGLGLLLVRSLLVAPAIQEKRLSVVSPITLPAAGGHYLVRPRDGTPSATVTAFCQWLREELQPSPAGKVTAPPGNEN